MKLIVAFFKLIRWPNLVFIALTQVLFYFIVIRFIYSPDSEIKPNLDNLFFILLVIASLLIAAGGYIINDYFDLNIDLVNKPFTRNDLTEKVKRALTIEKAA